MEIKLRTPKLKSRIYRKGKKALRTLERYGFGNISPDPLARVAGVGQKSVDALMEKGLAVEGAPGPHGRYFKLTNRGILATCWINGSRVRVYPHQ